jgi:hypothetical protein
MHTSHPCIPIRSYNVEKEDYSEIPLRIISLILLVSRKLIKTDFTDFWLNEISGRFVFMALATI